MKKVRKNLFAHFFICEKAKRNINRFLRAFFTYEDYKKIFAHFFLKSAS